VRRSFQWLIILAVFSVSFGSILARLSGDPPLVISFWRVALASLLLWPYVLGRERGALLAMPAREIGLAALSGLALALHFAAWISSLFLTTVSNATVLGSTYVIFTALAERVHLRRAFPWTFNLAILLSLAGMFLIANADFRLHAGPALLGDLLALAGGAMAALYFLVGSALRARISIAVYASLSYSFAALFLLAAIIFQGTPLWPGSASSWLFLVLLTLGPQLLGHTVLNYLLAEVRPAFLTLTILVEPVAATLWAFLIFGEVPSLWAFAGGALILLALAITPRQSIWKTTQ